MALCVCHTVVVEHKPDGSKVFRAQSPDEEALVKGAQKNGFTLLNNTTEGLLLEVTEEYPKRGNSEQEFKIRLMLEFTGDRRRMSVVVEDKYGKLSLYCKGADTVMFERLAEKQDNSIQSGCVQLLERCSRENEEPLGAICNRRTPYSCCC